MSKAPEKRTPIREHPKYPYIVHFINISFGLIIFKSWQINHANECANCIVLYKLFAALHFFTSFSLVLVFVCNVFGCGVKAINDKYIRNRHFSVLNRGEKKSERSCTNALSMKHKRADYLQLHRMSSRRQFRSIWHFDVRFISFERDAKKIKYVLWWINLNTI